MAYLRYFKKKPPVNTSKRKLIAQHLFFILSISTCFYGCEIIRSTGKNPSGEQLKGAKRSPDYSYGRFYNLEPDSGKINFISILKEMSNRPGNVRPFHILPAIKTDLIHTHFDKPTIIWFGHSSFLLSSPSANILVDPEFSGYAGPFPGMIKAFDGADTYHAEDMPMIDALLISHDHYDHLDYETIKALKGKVKMVIVPQGIGSHFVYWGYDPKIVHELNWNDSVEVNNKVSVTVTPARHTSARTIARNKTLWGSFVVKLDGYKLFYSGDSGYGKHFKLIGDQYGPFDLAIMECGQYGKNWPHHHMFPSQTAQAAKDLKAQLIIPVHWAKFAESNHPWNESVNLMIPVADSLGIPVCIPKIGEPYTLGTAVKFDGWWK